MSLNKISFFSVPLLIMGLILGIIFLMTSAWVFASPPLDEISAIMSAKALYVPSSGKVVTLDESNLDKSLLAIDPYARYVKPGSSHKDSCSRSMKMGIDFFVNKSLLWVQPIPGGPGDRAGVPELGILIAVNGKKVHGYDLNKISLLINDSLQKEQIILTVANKPTSTGKDYKINTSRYSPPPITWRYNDNALIMGIREFVTHYSFPSFSSRLKTLRRPGNRLVLDLRGCSGGDFYEALEIAGMFVPSGLPLVYTYDRNQVKTTYKSPVGKKLKSPDWVLIDNRTASAAEILVGILQYHHLSKVIGEKSYGKCLSQTLFPLSDGGVLWLTTLDIRFPDNKTCTGVGLTPDIIYPEISVTSTKDIFSKLREIKPSGH